MTPVLLGDLFELKYGKALRKDTRSEGVIPVYGSNGQVDTHNVSFIDHPTIIVGRKGSIGEVSLVKEPCWPIDTTYYVEALGPYQFDLDWLYRLLGTLRLQDLNRSAAIPGLNREDVYRIPVMLPPLDDQIRIAHLLGKVEGLIAQRQQHLQQLDDLLKSVFLEMFGDPVRNDKGWDKPELLHFGKLSTGNTPPRSDPDNFGDEFIEWIKTDNILADSVFVSTATEHLSRKGAEKCRQVRKGALLVACIAGSVESIGRAALTDRTVSFNQQINAIQPNDDIDPIFLHGLFKLCKTYIQSHASKGMKKILTKGDFEKITMIKPPHRLQTQYSKVADKIESIKQSYRESLDDLEILYSALSQKAFAGEMDISRVSLSEKAVSAIDEAKPYLEEGRSMKPTFDLPAPSNLAILQTPEGRRSQLNEWLTAWVAHLEEAPFVAQDFMDAVRQLLSELPEGDTLEWGATEYDELKAFVFEALNQGRLTQVFDDENNHVQVKTAKR